MLIKTIAKSNGDEYRLDLQAPTNIIIQKLSDNSIFLKWDCFFIAQWGFKIERKDDNNGQFVQVGMAGANDRKWIDTKALINHFYEYRICAYTDKQVAYSNIYPINFTGKEIQAPIKLQATLTNGHVVQLNWDIRNDKVDSFIIERSIDGMFAKIDTIPARHGTMNVKTYVDKTSLEGIQYSYRIKVKVINNESAYSQEVTIHTLPLAPTGLTAREVTDDRIRLVWAVNSSRATGYIIEKGITPFEYSFLAKTDKNVSSYEDVGAFSIGGTYYYRIRAYIQKDAEYVFSPYADPLGISKFVPVSLVQPTPLPSSPQIP